jgi:hypothetical protein
MSSNALESLDRYSRFIAELVDRPTVERSTLTIWPVSKYSGIAEGEVFLAGGYHLRIREELDFDAGIITAYGYEIYKGDERLYWYDDFPHPNDPTLASTHPHHKHVPPDIKHNRIPATEMSYSHPNLPVLILEVEDLADLSMAD